MTKSVRTSRWAALAAGAIAVAAMAAPAGATSHAASAPLAATTHKVVWIPGYAAPGTPAKYNKVGILKVGPSTAKNVLVIEPGTLAGSTYFLPLATWLTSSTKGWQVWTVERRENLLEDQSRLDQYKQHKITSAQLFNYYLGYLTKPSVTPHFHAVSGTATAYAKSWGMAVAVNDLHAVIAAAKKLGGKVVLGGHSLGGTVVTAYATWNFKGTPGANGLSGLVYLDGGSFPTAIDAPTATTELASLMQASTSPYESFGGIPSPYAGLFVATGSATALQDPNSPSLGQASGLLPKSIVPPVPVTNVAQFGYALNVASSPPGLVAAQAHLGAGLSASGTVHGWDSTGALTPIARYAAMFEGSGVSGADGSEWYFPTRLSLDGGAVDNGLANPAQAVLGVNATMGRSLSHALRIYVFAASLFSTNGITAAQDLAAQSGIPSGNLTIVDEHTTYAHNDPIGAYPTNQCESTLHTFLSGIH